MSSHPNKLLQLILEKIERPHVFLDLGAGRGSDALWMARNGWSTVAVDRSKERVDHLQRNCEEENLSIEVHCGNAEAFSIEENTYFIIQLFNVLQFISKEQAKELLLHAKKCLIPGGYIIVSGFTTGESSYKQYSGLCYFQANELKELFSDFEINYYQEEVVNDPGHPDRREPHQHHIVRMAARKKVDRAE